MEAYKVESAQLHQAKSRHRRYLMKWAAVPKEKQKMRNLRDNANAHGIAVVSLIIVLLASLAGMADAASPAAPPGPQELQVTESEAGQAVEINGEVLVVNLESNPSTGYGWQVKGTGHAHPAPAGGQRVGAATRPGKLGGPGTQVLRFAAVEQGPGHPQPRLCPPLGERGRAGQVLLPGGAA